jgi:hypothetical protein
MSLGETFYSLILEKGVYYNRKVRHEAAQGDEGRSLGAGLQQLASNHLKLLETVLFEVRGWKNHGPLKEDLVEVSGLLRPSCAHLS